MLQPQSSIDTVIKTKRATLKCLNEEIADRVKYRRDNETKINELVEAGNTQLMGLTHDIELAKKELKEIKTDIRTAAREKVLLNEDLDALRTELTEGSNGMAIAYA